MVDDAVEQLHPRHQLILRVLEDANGSHERVVVVGEVLAELAAEETKLLKQAYAKDLSSAVGAVLRQLVEKELVVSPGKRGGARYYGSRRVLAPGQIELPDHVARRRRSLAFVERVARDEGRALRMVDIRSAVEGSELKLDPELVARDVANLKRTGEIIVLDQVRGDGGGRNLYLPASLEAQADAYLAEKPETWLEQVAAAYNKVWAHRLGDAEWCGSPPLAVATGEVREQVRTDHPDHPRLEDPQLLVNALRQLARSGDPVLEKIDRPDRRSVLWVPAGLDDHEYRVDDAYAHDTERVAEAVRRAEERRNVPAVTEDEVTFEIERDPALQPGGSSAVYQLLSDVSKKTVDAGDGERRARRRILVRRVGRVAGRTYFTTGPEKPAAQYLCTLAVQVRWQRLVGSRRRDDLARCQLASVAYGRTLLLVDELEELIEEVDALATADLREDLLEPALEVGRTAAALKDDLEDSVSDLEVDGWWLDEVDQAVDGFTPDQLLEIVEPVYPAAQEIDDAHDLVPLLEERIWRIPNPQHTRRYDEDSEQAAEHLFERTSALCHVARRWGGIEAQLQGMMAASQLGRLRDVRFVLPTLEKKNPDRRLAGIACAAFLGCDRALPHLERLAEQDPEPGVRESAGWALRFVQAEGRGLRELLQESAPV